GDCFERFLALLALPLSLFVCLVLLAFLLRLLARYLALGRNLVLLDAPYALPIFSLVLARFFLVRSDGRLDHLLQSGGGHIVLFSYVTLFEVVEPLSWRLLSQSLHFDL